MKTFLERISHWLRFTRMYRKRPPWDTGISPPELVEFVETHPPRRAIDLGCGTGTNMVYLAKAGWSVTGVDFITRAVKSARLRLKQENIIGEVRLGDVSRYETVRGEYQLVLDIGCYHGLPFPNRTAYRKNLHRILSEGGWFLVYGLLAKEDQSSGTGITEAEFQDLCAQMILESRVDSLDRWDRSATWMRFRKREG